MARVDKLERYRISIPNEDICYEGKVSDFFDLLPNNSGITEEFLYTHQPLSSDIVNVYATSRTPVGSLDNNEEIRSKFRFLKGPVLLVARKGYAGRLNVIEDEFCIIHEDAYAAKIKDEYLDKINLDWFAGHYNFLFQSNRTSYFGIGDFPRERFNNMNVVIPSLIFQKQVSPLYKRRAEVAFKLNKIDSLVEKLIGNTEAQSI
jgi:hypothetical protein